MNVYSTSLPALFSTNPTVLFVCLKRQRAPGLQVGLRLDRVTPMVTDTPQTTPPKKINHFTLPYVLRQLLDFPTVMDLVVYISQLNCYWRMGYF